jgi:threonine dehydratase
MPADAYPNKIQACRDFGAEVVLAPQRADGDRMCNERVAAGMTLVHPYDAEKTVQGAGTVGLEIVEQWPEVEVVIVPCGGGGLLSGVSLAIRQTLGSRVFVIGVEPEGAPSLALGLEHGEPVTLERISTQVQGLCPPYSGAVNIAICRTTVDRVMALPDAEIFAAQKKLVVDGGWTVEPAGAAGAALVFSGNLPAKQLEKRSAKNPLRVAAVVSGGNPDPAQLAALRAGAKS